jgi:hypothetical protein
MAKEVKFEDLQNTLRVIIERADTSIAKFKKNLDESPVYAFQWGTDALAASATQRVAQEALHYLEAQPEEGKPEQPFETKLANLREYFTRQMMQAAESVPASTSVMSNMVDNYRRQALVKLVNTLNGEYFSGF